MYRPAFFSLTLLLCFASSILPGPVASPQTVEVVADQAKLSVCVILSEDPTGVSSGTGFALADRFVLTAYHVVEAATRIVLKFPDYPPVDARLVWGDKQNDAAVLRIPSLPVRSLRLGDIGQLHIGQTVVVQGFPRIEALGTTTATVTEGIVSAMRPGIIQMQAPVSPGNSGGPVLTLGGQVIGIVRATLRGQQQGINFATAINAIAPPSFQITPGLGVGPVGFGMRIEQILSILGPPQYVTRTSGAELYGWPKSRGFLVDATESGDVLRISIFQDSRYRTPEGVHIGSNESTVFAALGQPTRRDVNLPTPPTLPVGFILDDADYYDSMGLTFHIDRQRRTVSSIEVDKL